MALTAIFGGTFNPFHIGHYEMLSALDSADFIEKILLMPAKLPPHKICDFLADDESRIRMCEMMCEETKKAVLEPLEFSRTGKSYSYDTVMLLKKKYPEKQLAFVIGADMLLSLDSWYKFELLLREIPFIVFGRGDCDTEIISKKMAELEKMGGRFIFMDKKITDISSTKLRSNIKAAKEFLPERIFEYITEKGIYNEKNTGL